VLGIITLNGAAQAVLTTSALPLGSNSVTASYSGDAGDIASVSGSVSVTISAPAPIATMTAVSANPPATTIKKPVTLTASVTPLSGAAATGVISFYDAGVLLGKAQLNAGTAVLTVSAGFAFGTQSISAVYGGSGSDGGSTGSISLPITALRGDVNHDGQVDKNDVALITAVMNTAASAGDPRDLNGDGVINILDSRIDVTLCTYAGCATN
jgi:hypothetical protein